MTNYTLNAGTGAFGLVGQDATMRHLVRLRDDDPVLMQLGSISSNYAEVERFYRDAIDMVDSGRDRPLAMRVERVNQLIRMGDVLREGLQAFGCPVELLSEFDAFVERLIELQAKRNRMAHDALRRDKKTGELVRLATSGPKKVTVVSDAEVDEVVSGFRQLFDQLSALRAAIWNHANGQSPR